jgi:hypothetical protein
MVQFKTNTQMEEDEKAENAKRVHVEDELNKEPSLLTRSLANHLRIKWEAAKRAKINTVETQMFTNLKQAMGTYESTKLKAIREIGGSEVFIGVTDVKCRNAIAWIKDILFQPNSKPWAIEPTPVPELGPDDLGELEAKYTGTYLNTVMENTNPEEPLNMQGAIGEVKEKLPQFRQELFRFIREKAEEKAKIIERELNDKLVEGGWYEALDKCIYDIVVIKNGFIKGPIKRFRNVHKVVKDEDTGQQRIDVVREVIDEWDRRSPFDIYPEPDSNGIDDGYYFDHVSYRRSDLQALIGVDGFNESEIRAVLRDHVEGGLREWTGIESDRAAVENKTSDSFTYSNKIDCLEYVGPVPGSFLVDWGINDKGVVVEDSDLDYETTCWLIGNHVIKAMVNEDSLGKRNMATAGYDEVADSFWHYALPEKIVSVQSVVNAAARAMVNNLGMGSGPQVEINTDRLRGGEKGDTRLIPWKRWLTTNRQQQTGNAINFWQPQMHAQEIMDVLSRFIKIADEHSGIPAYSHGDPNVGGAGNALANHENILTPGGPVPIGTVHVGDLVVNSYGSSSIVTGVYPQGLSDIFRVLFSNGEWVDCDLNHRWSVKDHHDRKFQTLTTGEILSRGIFKKTKRSWRSPRGYRPKWMLPIIDCISFESRPVKIDPYTMGAILGDGDCRCRVTSMDEEIFERIPYPLGKIDDSNDSLAYARTVQGIKQDYLSYGLECKTTEKFIPEDYLFNTKEVRLELLRGLMDTDGCCSNTGEVFFSSSSYALITDFVKLVKSLGGITGKITEEEGSDFLMRGRKCTRKSNYRVVFNLPGEKIFHLKRKQERVSQKYKTHTYITGIQYIGESHATCITVDSDDQLFLCENFIPTHNTASGLSMLISQASRAIKAVMRNIDLHIIIPTIQSLYNSLLEDPKYADMVGDIHLVAKGSQALVEKEQRAVRMIELINASQAPINAQVLGMKGLQYLWTELAKTYEIDPDKLIAGNVNPQQNPATAPGTPGAPEVPGVPGMPASEAPPGGQLGLGAPGSAPGTQTVGLAGEVPSGGAAQLIPGQGGHPSAPSV